MTFVAFKSPFRVEHHPELPSTNDRALERAREDAPSRSWWAVVADRQTAGRGRRGHRWSSPPGGLYVSFLTWPALAPSDAPLLPLLCGCAVHQVASGATPVPLGLKWPNDLWVAESGPRWGRKLGGILVESVSSAQSLGPVVFGIGLNLRPAVHGGTDGGQAISLEALQGPCDGSPSRPGPGERDAWVERLGLELANGLDRAARQGLGFVTEDFQARAFGVGHAARFVPSQGEPVKGVYEGVIETGAVALRTASGQVFRSDGSLEFLP